MFFYTQADTSVNTVPRLPTGALQKEDDVPGRNKDSFSTGFQVITYLCRVEVKVACSYTLSPSYVFKTWCLFKHRRKFSYRKLNETVQTDNR
jgi:hypothetical protein